jgi:hypothetical protein
MPATYCDSYSVNVWPTPGVVRLTFAEYTQPGTLPFFRAAVVLPIAEAKALAEHLIGQIQALEREEEEQEEKVPPVKPETLEKK